MYLDTSSVQWTHHYLHVVRIIKLHTFAAISKVQNVTTLPGRHTNFDRLLLPHKSHRFESRFCSNKGGIVIKSNGVLKYLKYWLKMLRNGAQNVTKGWLIGIPSHRQNFWSNILNLLWYTGHVHVFSLFTVEAIIHVGVNYTLLLVKAILNFSTPFNC